MRLGEDLSEEELEEAAPVAQPVMAVVLGPALVAVELVGPWVGGTRCGSVGELRHRRRDEQHACDTFRMAGTEVEGVERAQREPGDAGGRATRRVEYRGCVVGELDGVVCLARAGAIGEAIATSVEGDDTEVPGEVGDLPLPVTRMQDRPRGHQQDRPLAFAVAFPVDLDPVAFDEALVIRQPGRAASVASAHAVDRMCHGLASNTRLNGVSAARRKRVNPPAAITSPILASPACAPSASPTSCDSDAGVHRNVEKP